MSEKKNLVGAKGRKFSGNPEDFRLSLVEHLDELRTRIVRSLLALTAGMVLGWFQFANVYAFLEGMVRRSIETVAPGKYTPKFDNLTSPFFLQLQLSFYIGLILAFPFIVLQVWGFISPALKEEEQRPVRRLAPVSVLLFAMGVGFCWLILPTTLEWFASFLKNFENTQLLQTAGTMVFFIVKMLLAFGFAFQLPLFVYVLGALELLRAETLLKYWRHSSVAIFLFASVVTPSQDPVSMLIMAVPLTLLFIASVYAVKMTQRKKRRKALEQAEPEPFLLPPSEPTTEPE